jgi:hypothetical protein
MIRKLLHKFWDRNKVHEERGSEVEGSEIEVDELDESWADGSGYGALTTDEFPVKLS